MDFRFHPEAREELDDAIAWYTERDADVGRRFRERVGQAIELLRKNPFVGAAVKDTPYRHYVIRGFDYVIFYEDRGGELIIEAIAHTSRRPGYWMKRREK